MRKLSNDLQTMQSRIESSMDLRTKRKAIRTFYMALVLVLAVAYFAIRIII